MPLQLKIVSEHRDLVGDDAEREFGEEGGTGSGADPMAFTHTWHQAIIEDFAEAIAKGRNPVCTGREALLVHGVIDALVRSSRP